MKILGIETSCDETAVAIVEDGTHVIASTIASSSDLHAKTGGIVPEVAARKQVESAIPVLDQTLLASGVSFSDIDAIAVTQGPGLVGSLLVGIEMAKTLAILEKKPLIPVNHVYAHLYANWIDTTPPEFPLIGLIVSGGHSDFVYMKGHGDISWIGGTRDDAAGEAFDKTARLIGLGYPGGPKISEYSARFIEKNPDAALDLFPRPMIDTTDVDMSFSGLKTAVSNYLARQPVFDKEEVSANVQEAIIDVIVQKSRLAINNYKTKSFLIAGGVSANLRLRNKLEKALPSFPESKFFYVPSPYYSTDNAVMIASCAYFNQTPVDPTLLTPLPSLSVEAI